MALKSLNIYTENTLSDITQLKDLCKTQKRYFILHKAKARKIGASGGCKRPECVRPEPEESHFPKRNATKNRYFYLVSVSL